MTRESGFGPLVFENHGTHDYDAKIADATYAQELLDYYDGAAGEGSEEIRRVIAAGRAAKIEQAQSSTARQQGLIVVQSMGYALLKGRRIR